MVFLDLVNVRSAYMSYCKCDELCLMPGWNEQKEEKRPQSIVLPVPFCAVQSPNCPFTLSLQLSPTVSTAGRLLNSQSGLLGKLGCLGKVEPGPLSYVWMIHNAPLLLYIFFVARSPVFAWTTFNVKNTYNFESECYHPGLPIFSLILVVAWKIGHGLSPRMALKSLTTSNTFRAAPVL